MTLGSQLRRVRQDTGLTQADLVKRGVSSQSTISEVENDKRPTTTDVVERWVQTCGAEIVIRRHDAADPLAPLLDAARGLGAEDLALLARLQQAQP